MVQEHPLSAGPPIFGTGFRSLFRLSIWLRLRRRILCRRSAPSSRVSCNTDNASGRNRTCLPSPGSPLPGVPVCAPGGLSTPAAVFHTFCFLLFFVLLLRWNSETGICAPTIRFYTIHFFHRIFQYAACLLRWQGYWLLPCCFALSFPLPYSRPVLNRNNSPFRFFLLSMYLCQGSKCRSLSLSVRSARPEYPLILFRFDTFPGTDAFRVPRF